jgi:hypothetical protein
MLSVEKEKPTIELDHKIVKFKENELTASH